MIELNDLHWLAGLLEGEGHFTMAGRSLQVGMTHTDGDIVRRAARIMGGTVYGPYRRRPLNRKPCLFLRVTSVDAAGWMMTLYPLMGARRKTRIRELLEKWRQPNPRSRWGTLGAPRHIPKERDRIAA